MNIRPSDESVSARKDILTLETMAPKVTVGPAYSHADLMRDDLKRTRQQHVDAVFYAEDAEKRGSHPMVISSLKADAERYRRICEALESRIAEADPINMAAE